MSFQKIVFAGHSACFIHTKELVIAIDPWLQANPSCPDDLKSPDKIDLIVLTHGHFDHASEAAGLAKSLGSKVIATFELAQLLGNEGVPESQLCPMNKGGTLEIEGLNVSLTHAMHSSSYETASGPQYAGEACGVVLGDGIRNLYHAGDTALFSDMSLIKDQYQPEIALLPIGDRFTMGPVEA
ncbi:MAG: metal-dependent hydrolase, partial [Bdellovibrionales bacterium]|nr:metal-dependent hydrolase [Bdellovibrionales bacterium]